MVFIDMNKIMLKLYTEELKNNQSDTSFKLKKLHLPNFKVLSTFQEII